MAFRGILFDQSEAAADIEGRETPEFFAYLNLDQVIAVMTAGREEYIRGCVVP